MPNASCNLPGRQRKIACCASAPAETKAAANMPSLFGFAPGGVYLATTVTSRAVRSYRTLSPLPRGPGRNRQARRYTLCGTFPGVAPAGCYPAPYLHGARTFLPPRLAYSFANSGHPTVWQDGHIRFEDRCKFQVSDTNTYICMNICNLTYRLTINWLSYDKHST